MSARNRALAVLVLLASAQTTAAARAQTIPSPYRFIETRQELSGFVGLFGADPGVFEFGPQDGRLVGIRYNIRLNGPISLEGTASYVPTTRSVIDPNRAEGNRKVGEADVQLGLVQAAVQLSPVGDRTWHALAPFLLIGGGVGFDMAGDQVIDNKLANADDRFQFGTTFVGDLGAGLRWLPTRSWGLRSDARFTIWQLDTPAGYRRSGRGLGTVEEKEWVSSLILAVGLAFSF